MDYYSDRLKDPRWQRRRLEILSRDKWMCIECGDEDSSLHVHHRYYEKGADLWEYPDKALVTLCDSCHQQIHDMSDDIKLTTGEMNIEQLHFSCEIMRKLTHCDPVDCREVLDFITKLLKAK
jgi:hypothetical protein